MRELKGKVAVVTGAASGIGRALATRFGQEGMKIVLADVEEGPLLEVREEFTRAGVEAIAMAVDVAQWEQVEALARRTLEAFQGVHLVCNNAGVAPGGPCWEVPLADWQWVLGVNLWGVIHGIRAFVPRLVAQREGHVINTASIAGLITAPGMGAYCATKHAVVALSECLHHDLTLMGLGGADGVGVSVVCPAWVKTRIADSERNRPASSPPPAAEARAPQALMIEGLVRQAIAGGIAPEEVAEQALRAVVDGRFWVLTHPKTLKAVERRLQGVLAGTPPPFDTSAM
jgi:NAD(P)-dependent dehydrogenase (short-subunit alcohol dehydrogenase family)